jgi:hypothetical protein
VRTGSAAGAGGQRDWPRPERAGPGRERGSPRAPSRLCECAGVTRTTDRLAARWAVGRWRSVSRRLREMRVLRRGAPGHDDRGKCESTQHDWASRGMPPMRRSPLPPERGRSAPRDGDERESPGRDDRTPRGRESQIPKPGEQTDQRTGYRNGSYERALATRVGTLDLEVPRDRDGTFQTELFQRYQRSEKALVPALMEMVVQGVTEAVRNRHTGLALTRRTRLWLLPQSIAWSSRL